jgi:hypothetical protein
VISRLRGERAIVAGAVAMALALTACSRGGGDTALAGSAPRGDGATRATFRDLNHNGQLDAYEDSLLSP